MLAVQVSIQVKADCVEKFLEVTKENAVESLKEAGIARFDILQDREDACHFMLTEVFLTADAPALHKETQHYADWKVTVADMMAAPRSSSKFETIFPDSTKWECA